MQLKRYFFAAVLLMVAVGAYVYQMISQADYTLTILGRALTLPLAAWIVAPMLLIFLASFFHMLYYGYKAYRRRKRVTKDIEKLADALYWDLLKAPRQHNYTDLRVRPIGAVLDAGCDDFTKIDKKRCHEKVRDAIDIITAIQHGEVIEVEKLKLEKSNPYVIQNGLNMLRQEPQRAEEVLRRMPYYDEKVIFQALTIFAEDATEQQLGKYEDRIDLTVLEHMIDTLEKRDDRNRLPLSFFAKRLPSLSPDASTYLRLAGKMVKRYTPHELLAFFEKLVAQDEKAFRAYLYTLVEFEMLDKAGEILEDTQKEEFLDFKAYLDLRRAGKHYPIDLFLKP